MIIADTNLFLYLVVNGDFTAEAVRVLECDPNWYAPESWQPECINVLTTYCRNGLLSVTQAVEAFNRASHVVAPLPRTPSIEQVVRLAIERDIAGYDAFFVAAAKMNNAPLITFDKEVLRKCSDYAKSTAQMI